MGDRGNIVIRDGDEAVWLYTHWGGSGILDVAYEALKKGWRWDDASYLTRIVFDILTAGNQGQETGFGIWTSKGDNGHSVILIDVKAKVVRIMPSGWSNSANKNSKPLAEFTFGDFITKEGYDKANKVWGGKG